MTAEEALKIIKYVHQVYEVNFTSEKAEFWAKMLMKKADYVPTLAAIEHYIDEGNSFPPKLPNIMRRTVKKLQHTIDDKTKEHRYRMEHDSTYREARQEKLDELKKRFMRFEEGS